MKKFLLATVFPATFALLAACGDDVTEVTEIHQDGMAVLDAGLELSKQKCDTTNVGDMLFVTDSSEVFVCNGKTWQTLKGADGEPGTDGDDGSDGESCIAKPVTNGAGLEGIEVTCGKTVVGTIWNGEKGEPGTDGNDGDDGENGESCTAEPVKNSAGLEGLEVSCGETVIDTVWNGKDGVGCSVKDEGDGTLTVTCGDDESVLYKAACGTEPYDPTKSFCSDGKLYSCNDEPYDPTKSFCSEGELYELCDGETYDPAKSFCSDGKLYSCNDEPYDPTKSFCSEGEIYELCDGKTYDPKELYCLKVTRGETDIYSVEALLTDARDEQHIQVYKTVKICNDKSSCQTWMAQNLNYAYNEGTVKSYCYDGVSDNCANYGRLYTWAAAIDSVALANDADDPQTCGYGETCTLPTVVQGICPEGWHLPSYDEWKTLFTNVGGKYVAGRMLKSEEGWNKYSESNKGIDYYGFSALPAGYRSLNGGFNGAGNVAYFCSSSEKNSNDAYYVGLYYDDESASLYYDSKDLAFSVRCLKDN